MIASTLAGIASLLVAASPATALESPVQLVGCDYSVIVAPRPTAPEAPPIGLGNLRISFVNQGPVAASEVRFAVRYADRTELIDDVGAFGTGSAVTQDFTPAITAPYGTPVQCSVQSVSFIDGTIWQQS